MEEFYLRNQVDRANAEFCKKQQERLQEVFEPCKDNFFRQLREGVLQDAQQGERASRQYFSFPELAALSDKDKSEFEFFIRQSIRNTGQFEGFKQVGVQLDRDSLKVLIYIYW